MWMKIEELIAAFDDHRLTFPPGAGHDVVELEMVDEDAVAVRILWMEGRDYDVDRIAHGDSPARTPVADDEFAWPDRYVDLLRSALPGTHASLETRDSRTHATSHLGIVVRFGKNATTEEIRQAFEQVLPRVRSKQRELGGNPRRRRQRADFRIERAALFFWLRGTKHFGGPFSYREIADKWEYLTGDWIEALREMPEEWPDSLRSFPQALPAFEEWLDLEDSDVEVLDERTVRETVDVVIQPQTAGG